MISIGMKLSIYSFCLICICFVSFCLEIVVSKERKPRKVKHDPNHDIILSTLFYTNLVAR